MRSIRWLAPITLSVALVASPQAATAAPQSWAQRLGMPAEVIAEYVGQYPDMPMATLMARLALLPARKQLLEQFGNDSRETFAGSWYDYRAGVWQLRATTTQAADSLARRARARGIAVAAQAVRYSLATLHSRARAISRGDDRLFAAGTKAGVDVERNRVTVALPADLRAGQRSDDPMIETVEPSGSVQLLACNDRRNCGSPLRGGLVIWRNNYVQPECSLGFTATASDGSRWALTAGHCIPALNEIWGHGQQMLGPVRQCSGWGGTGCLPSYADVDVARIKIDNAYWLANTSRGYVYSSSSDKAVDVDKAIGWIGSIEKGDAVCYFGWHRNDTGFSSNPFNRVSSDGCGTIADTSDPNAYGMPRVDSLQACHGDSGGAVIFYPGGGVRTAFGLVHGGVGGTEGEYCSSTHKMVFSPLPYIYDFFDANSAATIRVDTR